MGIKSSSSVGIMIVVKKERGPSIVEHLDADTLQLIVQSLVHGRTTRDAVRLACVLGQTCANLHGITDSVIQSILLLDVDQLRVFKAAMKGDSILITGVAGQHCPSTDTHPPV